MRARQSAPCCADCPAVVAGLLATCFASSRRAGSPAAKHCRRRHPRASEPWEVRRAALQQRDRFDLSGRIAVAAAQEGFNAKLRWKQQGAHSNLALDGPLGVGGVRITAEGSALKVINSRGQQLDSEAARQRDDCEARLRAAASQACGTGCSACPTPRTPRMKCSTTSKRLATLRQDGWQIDYASYSTAVRPVAAFAGDAEARRRARAAAGGRLGLVSAGRGIGGAGRPRLARAGEAESVPARHRSPARRLPRPADALSAHRPVRRHRHHRPRRRRASSALAGPADIPPETDLVVRAARALQAATGTPLGAGLRVRKRIPHGWRTGRRKLGRGHHPHRPEPPLGLWTCPCARLAEIGLTLGSDVPVFVYGSSAWAEGRGEVLDARRAAGAAGIVVIHPRVHVATAAGVPGP